MKFNLSEEINAEWTGKFYILQDKEDGDRIVFTPATARRLLNFIESHLPDPELDLWVEKQALTSPSNI